MRESCVESAKIVLNKESGKADFEGMKCHGIQGIDDGTHGRLHSEKSVEPAMDTLKKDSGKVEIKCHEGNGTCKRLHTEEHRETEGEVCVQMIESNRKEGVVPHGSVFDDGKNALDSTNGRIVRGHCLEPAKSIVLKEASGKADFEEMECHGRDGTHGTLHSKDSFESAKSALKDESAIVEIKYHEQDGTHDRLHTEEHQETEGEGEGCVQMTKGNRKEDGDCIEPAKSTTKIKCCDEQQQQPAVTKPSEASSSSQPIAADDINHLPNEPVRDYELVETDNNHADNGKVRRIEPGGSIEPKSESSDENEEHSNGQEEEQKSNAVKLESNVIFAARDIRYYPQDSSTPQEYGWTNDREKFRRDWRDRKVTEAEMKQNQTLFVRNLSYKVSNHDLYKFLCQFGPVHDCHIAKDHQTKESRGLSV
jgi:hypothetical protein